MNIDNCKQFLVSGQTFECKFGYTGIQQTRYSYLPNRCSNKLAQMLASVKLLH